MASRSLGTLTLDLVVKTGAFIAGMSQAERAADSRLRGIEKRAGAFGKQLGTALGVGITAALGAGIAAIDSAIDRMDALRDMSIRLGVGVETLSAFGYAAEQTGTDIETLGNGLKILAKNAADALNPKSAKAGIFDAIGVSVKDAQGNLRDLEELIPDIADAFSRLEDGTTKAALAQELFGKNGLALIEFLNQGGDGLQSMTDRARELGLVFDQEAADKADLLKDNIAELKAAFTGAATSVAIELLPRIIDLTEELKEFATDGNAVKDVVDDIASLFKVLGTAAGVVTSAFEIVGAALAGVAATGKGAYDVLAGLLTLDFSRMTEGTRLAMEGAAGLVDEFREALNLGDEKVEAPDFSAVRGAIRGVGEDFAKVKGEIRSASQSGIDLKALEYALSGAKPEKPKKPKKSEAEKAAEEAARAAKAAREDIDALNASLTEQITLFGETSEAARLRYQLEQEDISKLDAATQAYIVSQREIAIASADALQIKKEEAKVQEDLDRANERREEAAAQVLADIQAQRDLLGQTAEAQDTYNKLAYAGVDANSALGQAISTANAELHAQAKAVADQVQAMDLVREAGADILVGMVDAARGAADAWDVIKDAIDNVAASLTRMIAENLMERAFGEMGSTSGGSSGSWINTALGWLFGAMGGGGGGGTNTAVGPRAIGGNVAAGGMYRINENGPEMLSFGGRDYLMMGAQAGFVHAPDPVARPTAGRPFQQIVNVSVAGRPDRRTFKQIERATGAGARREMGRTGSF